MMLDHWSELPGSSQVNTPGDTFQYVIKNELSLSSLFQQKKEVIYFFKAKD